MARIKLDTADAVQEFAEVSSDIQELAAAWVANKVEADSYADIVKKQGDSLKAMMAQMDLTKITPTPGYTVSRVESTTVKFDQAKLLAVLKANGLNDMVETVEVVNMDALETYLYRNQISPELATALDACKNSVTSVALRLNKSKARKEN